MDAWIVAREVAVRRLARRAGSRGVPTVIVSSAPSASRPCSSSTRNIAQWPRPATTLRSRYGRASRFTTTMSMPPSLSTSPNAAARLAADEQLRGAAAGFHLFEPRSRDAAKQQVRLRVRIGGIHRRLPPDATVRLVEIEQAVVVEIEDGGAEPGERPARPSAGPRRRHRRERTFSRCGKKESDSPSRLTTSRSRSPSPSTSASDTPMPDFGFPSRSIAQPIASAAFSKRAPAPDSATGDSACRRSRRRCRSGRRHSSRPRRRRGRCRWPPAAPRDRCRRRTCRCRCCGRASECDGRS